jgi:hypothetical protein
MARQHLTISSYINQCIHKCCNHRGEYKGKSPLFIHKGRGWLLSARMRAFWGCVSTIGAIAAAYYVAAHIEEVPITGRKRFVPLRYIHIETDTVARCVAVCLCLLFHES